ncbi:MAG TPA: glycine oxidase ThiO [Actinomycetota bacterium]|nr:glycine oxidase ThiO [Actinomycetota bacterium]
MNDVVIVGGGVIGLSIARRAAQEGLGVLVLEKGEPGDGASGVAAGMLAPVTEASFGEEELLQLTLESARMYPEFTRELSQSTGMNLESGSPGTLFVALDRDQLENLRRLFDFQTSLGLEVEWIDVEQARELEPLLHPSTRGAVLAPGDKEVHSRRLLRSLASDLNRLGGRLQTDTEVAAVEPGAVKLSSGERVEAGSVVVAAGSWSSEIGGLPADLAQLLRPVKGQIIRLSPPRNQASALSKHVLRTSEVYLIPRGEEVVVGATVEELGYDTSITAGGVLELLSAADELVPGIREMEISEISAGLRPATPDNAPIIDSFDGGKLIVATGHYRNGILLAPVTAEAVVEALATARMPARMAPFALGRFK